MDITEFIPITSILFLILVICVFPFFTVGVISFAGISKESCYTFTDFFLLISCFQFYWIFSSDFFSLAYLDLIFLLLPQMET